MKTIKTIALSALIALGSLGGLTAASTDANAASSSIIIGGGGTGFGLYIGPGYGPHRYSGFGHRKHWRQNQWRRDHCPSGMAVHKARRMGLHRTYVKFRNHRVVVVGGHRHGHHRTIVFANDRFCPRIR
jgi:hypothetical protein